MAQGSAVGLHDGGGVGYICAVAVRRDIDGDGFDGKSIDVAEAVCFGRETGGRLVEVGGDERCGAEGVGG